LGEKTEQGGICAVGSFHGGNCCETSKIGSALQTSNFGKNIRSNP